MGQIEKQKSPRERRRHVRKPVALQINYETLDQFFEDYALNVSLGGVFIRSDSPLPLGTRLKIRFSLPELDELLETTGIVAHIANPEDDDGLQGMGIRFDDLDGRSKEVIDHLLSSDPADYDL